MLRINLRWNQAESSLETFRNIWRVAQISFITNQTNKNRKKWNFNKEITSFDHLRGRVGTLRLWSSKVLEARWAQSSTIYKESHAIYKEFRKQIRNQNANGVGSSCQNRMNIECWGIPNENCYGLERVWQPIINEASHATLVSEQKTNILPPIHTAQLLLKTSEPQPDI